jgi:hypothetical protein
MPLSVFAVILSASFEREGPRRPPPNHNRPNLSPNKLQPLLSPVFFVIPQSKGEESAYVQKRFGPPAPIAYKPHVTSLLTSGLAGTYLSLVSESAILRQ